jgi:hypothetical protein
MVKIELDCVVGEDFREYLVFLYEDGPQLLAQIDYENKIEVPTIELAFSLKKLKEIRNFLNNCIKIAEEK